MLADNYIAHSNEESNNELKTKINRLEHLSISMANLIESGNSDKIMHLEKIRKKILVDILKVKESISDIDKSQIKNIVRINSKLIDDMKKEKKSSLNKIRSKINFYKSNKLNY